MKNILIAGANSKIAGSIIDMLDNDYKVYTISRKAMDSGSNNYTADLDSLPDLDDEFDGLVYAPGTINLKPFRGLKEDIGLAARFLLSDESSWITGQVIAVDGGLSTLKTK